MTSLNSQYCPLMASMTSTVFVLIEFRAGGTRYVEGQCPPPDFGRFRSKICSIEWPFLILRTLIYRIIMYNRIILRMENRWNKDMLVGNFQNRIRFAAELFNRPPWNLDLPPSLSKSKVSRPNCLNKGQLILECLFGVFKSPKKTTKFFPGFLP